MNKKQLYYKLMEDVYDDNFGFCRTRKYYQKYIDEIEKKKRKSKIDKSDLEGLKRDLKEFEPTWISVDNLKKELLTKEKPKKSENWLELFITFCFFFSIYLTFIAVRPEFFTLKYILYFIIGLIVLIFVTVWLFILINKLMGMRKW